MAFTVGKIALMTAGVAAVLGAGAAAVGGKLLARGRVEQPEYRVEAQYDDFEVRRYAPRLVAEVEVEGSPEQATRAGFRILADFIFGKNESRRSVAMTSPVGRRASEKIDMTSPVGRRGTGPFTVTFTMPSSYTEQTLPVPLDDRIEIRTIEEQRVAVARFRGSPSAAEVKQRMDDLRQAVVARGLEPADAAPTFAQYDPPWTPPFLRRNEVWLRLEPRT